jgi:neutral cholesterol ester hydrolase 1
LNSIEWDAIKDEGLLYAERLREAGVDVHIEFYENAFHGIAGLVDKKLGYEKARQMQNDLIDYLQQNL